jgi:hypothetical protein
MLQQNQTTSSLQPKESEATLVLLMSRFEKNNYSQSELVIQIQEQCHKILNKRMPQQEVMGGKEKPMENCFADSMQAQLNRMEHSTSGLEAILFHLREIV